MIAVIALLGGAMLPPHECSTIMTTKSKGHTSALIAWQWRRCHGTCVGYAFVVDRKCITRVRHRIHEVFAKSLARLATTTQADWAGHRDSAYARWVKLRRRAPGD